MESRTNSVRRLYFLNCKDVTGDSFIPEVPRNYVQSRGSATYRRPIDLSVTTQSAEDARWRDPMGAFLQTLHHLLAAHTFTASVFLLVGI